MQKVLRNNVKLNADYCVLENEEINVNALKTASARNNQPVYSKGEELFNAVSHIVGGGLGILFCVIAFLVVAKNPAPNKFIAIGIYAFSLIMLYTMSALYHFFPQGRAKKLFRIFDHCTIFLLIAGCYTPFCLIPLWNTSVGKVVFFLEWGLAVTGIVFNAVNMQWKAVKIFSQISYVIMGWMLLPIVNSMLRLVPFTCFLWLLTGGIFYTVGIVFYALGKKKKYMHCVWHIFVLLGSIFQFVSILFIL